MNGKMISRSKHGDNPCSVALGSSFVQGPFCLKGICYGRTN